MPTSTNIVGIVGTAPWQGCFQPTGSSEATIAEARKAAKAGEALNVLTWGGETDLAQALHDGPSIAPPVRLLNIGTQDPHACTCVEANLKGEQDMRVDDRSTFRSTCQTPTSSGIIPGWHEENARGHGAGRPVRRPVGRRPQRGRRQGGRQPHGAALSERQPGRPEPGQLERRVRGNLSRPLNRRPQRQPRPGPAERRWRLPPPRESRRVDGQLRHAPRPGPDWLEQGAPAALTSPDQPRLHPGPRDRQGGGQRRADHRLAHLAVGVTGTGAQGRLPLREAGRQIGDGGSGALLHNSQLVAAGPAPMPTTPAPTGPETVAVCISGDAWEGDPNLALTVNGRMVDSTNLVTADHREGEWDTLVFKGDFDLDGSDRVEVHLLKDHHEGSGRDRNLHVNAVTLNGQTNEASESLYRNGGAYWDFRGDGTGDPPGPPARATGAAWSSAKAASTRDCRSPLRARPCPAGPGSTGTVPTPRQRDPSTPGTT